MVGVQLVDIRSLKPVSQQSQKVDTEETFLKTEKNGLNMSKEVSKCIPQKIDI